MRCEIFESVSVNDAESWIETKQRKGQIKWKNINKSLLTAAKSIISLLTLLSIHLFFKFNEQRTEIHKHVTWGSCNKKWNVQVTTKNIWLKTVKMVAVMFLAIYTNSNYWDMRRIKHKILLLAFYCCKIYRYIILWLEFNCVQVDMFICKFCYVKLVVHALWYCNRKMRW